ncbi:hypothetical protein [Aquimarina brevivitae]|uniref:Uncharacterized protein n=1 Tax=Aquimarina brevivitae TaxID=323412 RepID=A0A4Q7P112_9FLAO|nr:hypothetical protein [Aquimarina brevivitae]RZS93501.1 hypothetical protein EV197_2080 [Aquimarina brevivitae]
MELARIEKLLDKYFEGETTISEEKELKVYFTGETVPSHLEKYKDLFGYFSAQSNVVATRATTLPKANNLRFLYPFIGVAASVAIVLGVFFYNPNTTEATGTYEDPEVALQKTKEVLNLVAQYMNEGKKDLVYLNEFENTTNKLLK